MLNIFLKDKFFIALFCLTQGFSSFATDFNLSDLPYFKKQWAKIQKYQSNRYYMGQLQTKNHYARFFAPENKTGASLVLITGVEDPTPLWYNTALRAIEKGFRFVYIIEIRGQGYSQRVPGNKIKAIHVNHFENYYADLSEAFKEIDKEDGLKKPTFIISHSTGSLILVNSLTRIKQSLPHLNIQAMSFWTPLIKLRLSPLANNFIARPLLYAADKVYQFCCGLILGRKFKKEDFAQNKLTTSRELFSVQNALKYEKKLGSSGVSLSWGLQAVKAAKTLRNEKLKQIDTPTLILLAQNDQVVDNHFTINNPKIEIETINDVKHALHIEDPKKFNKVLNKTFSFFKKEDSRHF